MAIVQSGLKVDKEIRHFSHPQHALNLIALPSLYICCGCKEHGTGPRYRCNDCNFNLHEFCAKAPPTLSHPYHTKHQLIFYSKPGSLKNSKCEVCGRATNGSAFCCSTCNFCLHPCCSHLPATLFFKGHAQHTLKLLPGSPNGSPYKCDICKKKGTTWVYCCAACGFYLHALCAKRVINGPAKPTKFGRAVRYASQVAQVFVGGLVESLGEGVGDVIFNTRGLPINDDDKHGEI